MSLRTQRESLAVGHRWERQIAGRAGQQQVLRGGNRLLLGDQETISCDAERGMMVKAAPAAAFIVTRPTSCFNSR
jgi:hypothetical protein